MEKNVLTRREFLKTTSSAALAGTMLMGAPHRLWGDSEKKTRVILIRDSAVLGENNTVNDDVIAEMLDTAVTTLLGEEDPVAAWKRLVTPDDVVGIKSNEWNYLATPDALEKAIEKRVQDAGVSKDRIGIRDRNLLGDDIFMNATALINVRPARTHHWSGVGSLIKNYIMFVPEPSTYHDDSCADLAKIWKLPLVEGKTRLNILVMLTPLFHGVGPHHFAPKYTWPYSGLLVGIDPVAVDSVGVRILLAKRKEYFGEERPINPPPKHIFVADTRHHLGTADPEKIDLITIGMKDGILI